jgi:predicted component of type VI protein secretion system
MASSAGARLVSVKRDGSDGDTYRLLEDADLGRSEGLLRFADDAYLASRHARIQQKDGKFFVVALDQVNGIYVRLRESASLRNGDQFLVGQQVFRFETVSQEDAPSQPIAEHGVRLFGTPIRQAWGRLRQVTAVGTTRDVYHLGRPQYVIGRGEGDLVFPEDDFMSRRHAVILSDGEAGSIDDLGSSNGTYLRVTGTRELQPGDQIRLGDQLLRFETV